MRRSGRLPSYLALPVPAIPICVLRRSPQHQDLQRLASQVLMGQSLGLTDLQRKMESQQATLAELLKVGATGNGYFC